MFGDDILPLTVLALGAAMVTGSSLALLRPPRQRGPTELERPPVARSVVMITIGLVSAIWAVASLTTG
ncbi:MAG: hypothetical protein ACR2K0_00205 [Acidimicrobiales bacterium]|jgi:hypothetical protein